MGYATEIIMPGNKKSLVRDNTITATTDGMIMIDANPIFQNVVLLALSFWVGILSFNFLKGEWSTP